jgi:hypothetical protein
MGNTWEVWAYVLISEDEGYGYTQAWRGQSAIRCIREAIKAKRAGAGCVKVEWRG